MAAARWAGVLLAVAGSLVAGVGCVMGWRVGWPVWAAGGSLVARWLVADWCSMVSGTEERRSHIETAG